MPRLQRCFGDAGLMPSRAPRISADGQVAAKLATIFPALAPVAIAEALQKAGGDMHLAAEAMLRAALGQVGFCSAHQTHSYVERQARSRQRCTDA